MKYCSKCKRLHNDEETVCKNCKAQLKTITDENTPVYLLTASGFELKPHLRTAPFRVTLQSRSVWKINTAKALRHTQAMMI